MKSPAGRSTATRGSGQPGTVVAVELPLLQMPKFEGEGLLIDDTLTFASTDGNAQ